MGFFGKLIDREPNPKHDDHLFDDPADVSGTPGATPAAPPLPPQPNASTEEASAAPAEPVAYSDMGLRYVVGVPGKEEIFTIDYYEHQLQLQFGRVPGITVEQVLTMQFQSGMLRVELFYLNDDCTPAKRVDNPELRELYLKDYDRQKLPPTPPAPAPQPEPQPQPAPAAPQIGASELLAAINALSDADRQAVTGLLLGGTTPPAPPLPPQPDVE